MEQIKNMKWVSGAVAALALLVSGCEGGATSDGSSSSSNGGLSSTGIAGSTARMVIVDNYLYAIAGNKIQLFDINTPSSPNPWNKITIDWDIQTLYPYENYLLVGAADGVHILDNTDPASPRTVGDFTHATAIDPVVASNGYAYVTLKNDPQAFNSVDDQMSVISLADPANPVLKNVISMQSPEGLSVVGDRLFVCDGIAGIKQFDLSDPENPTIVDAVARVNCNDVIAYENILYAITDTSLQQYDYTMSPPVLLSIIETDEMSPDALLNLLGLGVQDSRLDINEL